MKPTSEIRIRVYVLTSSLEDTMVTFAGTLLARLWKNSKSCLLRRADRLPPAGRHGHVDLAVHARPSNRRGRLHLAPLAEVAGDRRRPFSTRIGAAQTKPRTNPRQSWITTLSRLSRLYCVHLLRRVHQLLSLHLLPAMPKLNPLHPSRRLYWLPRALRLG